MRTQDYAPPPKLTLGVLGAVAIIIPVLLGYFLVTGLSASPAYSTLLNGGGSTTTATATGSVSVTAISIPSGASNPSTGAPGYSPDTVTVVIGVNNTVTWTNNDSVAHTVTSDNTTAGVAIFASGNMAPGATYTHTFMTNGTYAYHCDYHSWMKGTVIVKVAAPPVSKTGVVAVSIPNGAGLPSGGPGYAPDNITVVIGVNNTVVWTNDDTAHHTVTSVSGNGSISSGDMPPGAVFNYTFTTPGTYNYICVYHPWMLGKVTVLPASTTPQVTTVAVSIPSGAGLPSGAPGYAPDNITLVIGVNNTVTWTNDDSAGAGTHHTVTSTSVPSGATSFNSGDMPVGATYTYTFTVPGTYQYDCAYHPWMVATVVVKAAPASAASAAPIAVTMPSGAGNPSGAPGYAPDKITLVIGVNNTVTWTNDDTAGAGTHHTVTSTSVPTGATSFNSGDMPVGATYTYTFTVPGTYQYDCAYHPWMVGTITVVQG